MLPFRPMAFPFWRGAGDMIRVGEYREDGTLVVRADLPGIDPDKDDELTISYGMLHGEIPLVTAGPAVGQVSGPLYFFQNEWWYLSPGPRLAPVASGAS